MPRQSAGLLCYRQAPQRLEVLLVHPGGPFWARRDAGAWTIPKGEVEPGEQPLDAAIREFAEETGAVPAGPFIDLGTIRQAGGKVVHGWAFERDVDAATIRSARVTMEWPPRSGRSLTFPEIDRAEWFSVDEARPKVIQAQLPLLDRLIQSLARER